MKKLATPKWFWAGWVAAGSYWEWRSLKLNDGATLSETTRLVLFTHTVPGKAAFLTGIVAFMAWFPKHILFPAVAEIVEAVAEIIDSEDSNGNLA